MLLLLLTCYLYFSKWRDIFHILNTAQLAFRPADALQRAARLSAAPVLPGEKSRVQEWSVPRAGEQLARAQMWLGQKNGVSDDAGSVVEG